MTFVDLLMVLDYRQSIIIVDLEKKGNDAFSKKAIAALNHAADISKKVMKEN